MAIDRPDGARWLAEHWAELRRYNFRWVAADGDGLIHHAVDLAALIERVAQEQRDSEAVYARLTFPQFGDNDAGTPIRLTPPISPRSDADARSRWNSGRGPGTIRT